MTDNLVMPTISQLEQIPANIESGISNTSSFPLESYKSWAEWIMLGVVVIGGGYILYKAWEWIDDSTMTNKERRRRSDKRLHRITKKQSKRLGIDLEKY